AQGTTALAQSNTRTSVSGKVRSQNAKVTADSNKTAHATTTIAKYNILTLNGVILSALTSLVDSLPDELAISIQPAFDTDATATIDGTVEAFLGTGADVTTGTLTLTANEADNDASATNNSAGVNLVNVAETAAKATINGATKVHIDQGASID